MAVTDGSAVSRAQREKRAPSRAHRFDARALLSATGIESRARRAGGLAPRLATAAIAGPLVVGLTLAGGPWFVVLVLIVTGLSALELSALLRNARIPASPVTTLLASWAFPLAAALHDTAVGTAVLGLTIVGGLLATARLAEKKSEEPPPLADLSPQGETGVRLPTMDLEEITPLPDPPPQGGRGLAASAGLVGWGLALATGLYVGALLAPSIALRERPDGLGWIALILAATWACDSAAYFIGRKWGAHKLAPSVSPQKSVEGTLAGVVAAVVVSVVAGAIMAEPGLRFVGLGVVLAGGAVIGDLVESILKRQLGAKDSGWIMPGHGGLLDRIDSLLLSSFLAWGYITFTDGLSPR